jgi:hypothetical protein
MAARREDGTGIHLATATLKNSSETFATMAELPLQHRVMTSIGPGTHEALSSDIVPLKIAKRDALSQFLFSLSAPTDDARRCCEADRCRVGIVSG